MADSRVTNFGAGPSALPINVLEEATKGLLNFNNSGVGVAEISHRSKEWTAYNDKLEHLIRNLLNVPDTHSILFTQCGGTGQFASVVLNMMARHRLLHPDLPEEERVMDYILTGSWSKKAAEEARRMGGGRVNVVADARKFSADGKAFDNIPTPDQYNFSPNPALIYYCENETADGVQFSDDESSSSSFPYHRLPKGDLLPLVADFSSSFMSRPIPRLADHAVIYAGAQKNVGPSGLTILIVRKDCLVDADAAAKLGAVPVPIVMSYKALADSKSLYNTPPVLPMYIAGLVLEHMTALGGTAYYEKLNKSKSGKAYAAIREGEVKGVFRPKVKEGSRSWMNIVFDALGDGADARFIAGAEKLGMKALKGHRSVGGIRVSLYNAITEEETDKLVAYMRKFIASESDSQ